MRSFEVRSEGGAEDVYYHHTDYLGTTEYITDSSKTIVWSCEYEAFGKVLTKTSSTFATSYTGKMLDEVTGLYYFNARWYDSDAGRFINEDPARDGLNWYVYCLNNPLVRIDPTGMFDFKFRKQESGDTQTNGNLSGEENNNINLFQMSISGSYPLMINGLMEIQNFVLAAEIYQEGAGGNFNNYKPEDKKTFCNQSSFDVGDNTGFHMSYVYGNEWRYDVSATEAYENLKTASLNEESSIREINSLSAQRFANKGFTIFAAADDTGHISTVRPDFNNTFVNVLLYGPTLANVGEAKYTGIKSTNTAFGKHFRENHVHYFMDINQNQIYSGTSNAAKKFWEE